MAPQCPDDMWEEFMRSQFQLQTDHYDEHWREGGTFDVIELKGKPVGRIYVWRGLDNGNEEIHIVEFTVLTEHRNQGIGSCIMRQVLDESDKAGQPVLTRISPIELSAPFLDRHGFTLAEDEGMSHLYKYVPSEC